MNKNDIILICILTFILFGGIFVTASIEDSNKTKFMVECVKTNTPADCKEVYKR